MNPTAPESHPAPTHGGVALPGLTGLRAYLAFWVIAFHIMDPDELDFPFRDPTLFKGLEGLGEILTEPHALRRAYKGEVDAFIDELRRGCQMIDIDYVPLRTDRPLDEALSGYLASRSARVR